MSIAKIVFILFLIGVIVLFVYNAFFKNRGNKKPDQANKEKNTANQQIIIAPTQENTDTGNTMVSTSEGWNKPKEKNGKGSPYTLYYLTYTNNGGVSMIEEITRDMYKKFLQDFPSGNANGNVVISYK